MSEGVDYAWAPHPSATALKAAGKSFVCRYLSHDSSKDLSDAEAAALASQGIWCVLVWETTASRAAGIQAAGVADAHLASDLASNLQMPADRPIYFAIDFDADGPECKDYFRGVVSVLGLARVGVYGGIRPLKWLATNGLASWFWQTYAWSGGAWFDKNHIEQYHNDVVVGGVSLDLDRSKQDDYGQWMPGKGPSVATSAKDTAVAVWNTDGVVKSPPSTQAGNPPNLYWAAGTFLQQIYQQNEKILANQTIVISALQGLATKIDGLGAHQAAADAKAVVSELSARLSAAASAPPAA